MAIARGNYTVGKSSQLSFSKDWPYAVLDNHTHTWDRKYVPIPGNNWQGTMSSTVPNVPVARFGQGTVTLLTTYRWDGSSGPAIDTLTCARASALHDVWCQAMTLGIYKNNFRNWKRGAGEYYRICTEDGMSSPRAWARYAALVAYWPFR